MTTNPSDELPAYLNPHSHINDIVQNLTLSTNVSKKAHTIVDTAPIETTTGKNPAGVAGGAVYLAALQCVEKHSQLEVADAAGVSESTIRLRFQALQATTGDEQ